MQFQHDPALKQQVMLLYELLAVCEQLAWFILWCIGALEDAKGDPKAQAALHAVHPRFETLQVRYGPMAGAAAPAPTGTTLSASMIEVHLVCVAPSAGKKMGRQSKKVPGKSQATHIIVMQISL